MEENAGDVEVPRARVGRRGVPQDCPGEVAQAKPPKPLYEGKIARHNRVI